MSSLVRKFLSIVFFSVVIVGLWSCSSGKKDVENGNKNRIMITPKNCEAIGDRFADRLAAIPANSGFCNTSRRQLEAYLEARPGLISAGCFASGQLAEWDQNIQILRQSVRNSCANVPDVPDVPQTSSWGAVSYDLMEDCSSFVYGIAYNHPSQASALNAARNQCTSRGGSYVNCRFHSGVFTGVSHRCAAIVFGETQSQCTVQAEYGTSINGAESAALNKCRSDGLSNCRVAISACNRY